MSRSRVSNFQESPSNDKVNKAKDQRRPSAPRKNEL